MAGFRSVLPLLGLSSGTSTNQPGYRSLLAPWIGGASSPSGVVTQAGFRGLLAFWIGGASADSTPAPPVDDTVYGGLHKHHRALAAYYLAKQRRDEEERDRLLDAQQIAADIVAPRNPVRYKPVRWEPDAAYLEQIKAMVADELLRQYRAERLAQQRREQDIVFVMMTIAAMGSTL